MLLPNLHILGIQGSGKGTQVAALVEAYKFLPISTGELFRKRATLGDDYGDYIRERVDNGELLTPDDLKMILTEKLSKEDIAHGILGDGVLRTIEQWELLTPVWQTYGLGEPILIHLSLSDELARERISKRHGYEHRSDDLPRAIERRLELYYEKTIPVVELFTAHGRAATIDASQSVAEVTNSISQAIHTFFPQFIPK